MSSVKLLFVWQIKNLIAIHNTFAYIFDFFSTKREVTKNYNYIFYEENTKGIFLPHKILDNTFFLTKIYIFKIMILSEIFQM